MARLKDAMRMLPNGHPAQHSRWLHRSSIMDFWIALERTEPATPIAWFWADCATQAEREAAEDRARTLAVALWYGMNVATAGFAFEGDEGLNWDGAAGLGVFAGGLTQADRISSINYTNYEY
jgi:hypothetical protein